MKSNLDKFGRIVIPKNIREELGLEPGDALDVELANGGIYLKPEHDAGQLHVREGVLVYTAESSINLDKAIEDSRKQRLDSLGTA